ncbi:MAG: major royal jelly protein [Cyanobacteria bacterium RYN_339]|nr:major royal jelly protein [Cyanobacteria bacterium RYN_339]
MLRTILAAAVVGGAAARTPELVATLTGPMPTGITVSQKGRIFINFPRWGDPVTATVAELIGGKPVAFPPGLKQLVDPDKEPVQGLVSVQSVVVDPKDRLWILDTGSVKFGPTHPGGPKLVGVELNSNQVFRTITFPPSVALPSSYLNDVRFDLRRGQDGMAFITDSSPQGGIIVADLATGESWRRLSGHASTRADANFRPVVGGQVLMQRKPGQPARPLNIGSDGIAMGADGKRLYYCALASHRLYSVSIDKLVDREVSDADVAESVHLVTIKPGSDGLESDTAHRLYLTDYEHGAIERREADGSLRPLVAAGRLDWPDTLSLATNGYLYFTNNELHRQADYHGGKDLRDKTYEIFRVKVDAKPVMLK